MASLTWFGAPGSEDAWRRLAFRIEDRTVRLGAVLVEIERDEQSWGFDRVAGTLDVPTLEVPPPDGPPVQHPNGANRIDHVVWLVPRLDDAVASLSEALGLEPRKRFRPRGEGTPEMAFFRAGEAVLEVVEGSETSRLWGLALRTPDLDATVAAVREAGGSISDPKPAVQGGRIASVWPGHLGMPLAVMEPPPVR